MNLPFRKAGTRPTVRRARPELEPLEGRDLPSTLGGGVFNDTNNNGVRDAGEAGIAHVTITLTGTTNQNQSVNLTRTTDPTGAYTFTDLQPGTYTLTETQPADFLLGQAAAGDLGGNGGTGQITGISVSTTDGTNYNFGDLPLAPRGGQGLRPTFWDQQQNAGLWLTYQPNQSFNAVFGVNAPGNPTLLQALQTTGGGLAALDRAAVAALLNASSASVDYRYTVDQVISMVQKAYQGGNVRKTTHLFKAQNSRGVREHPRTGSLTGFVRGDVGPLGGVLVSLTTTNSDGQTVTTYATTDVNGFYKFAGLRAGTYVLTVSPPGGDSSSGSVGTVNGAADGGILSPTAIGKINLTAGGVGVNYNFTETPFAGS
jgi:hypothetical protein